MAYVDLAYQHDPSTGQMLFDTSGRPIFDDTTNQANGVNTYAQLQSRIQNEVLGSPQTGDIQNAIADAIAMFDGDSFWFNTFRIFGDVTGSLSDLQTALGKEFYSQADLPTMISLPHISKALVLAFDNRYPLTERTRQWVDDVSTSPTWQGMPTDWAMQGGDLRIYPIPNGAYSLILDATIRFAPLSAPTDYSPWTNRAERLIRQAAKMLLFRDIIRDESQATVCQRAVYGDPTQPRLVGEFAKLKAESLRRAGGSGKLRPSRGYMS
jgi:hypothetical protein